MKSILCTGFLLLWISVLSQSEKIAIEYQWKVNSLKSPSTQKVPIKRIMHVGGEVVKTEIDSIGMDEILSRVSFEQQIYMVVSNGCSIAKYSGTSVQGLNAIMPDSVIYCNNQWITVRNKQKTLTPNLQMSFEMTGEFKTILGYNCQKIIGVDIVNGNKYFFWATEKLPSQVMPVSGIQFKYGILEIADADNSWSMLATKISLL